MSTADRIVLSLYFSEYNSPNTSRFEKFFESMWKKEKYFNKIENNILSSTIYPEKIIRNEDKRTSLMIKGIPTDISKKMVRKFLEQFGNINYLYLMKDDQDNTDSNSIAYINVINYKSIIPLFMSLRTFQKKRNENDSNLEIMYSLPQGKRELKEYIRQIHNYKYTD